MVLQSSQGLPELLFYTKKSYRILQLQLQLQFYKGTRTPSIHIQPTRAHYKYIQRILHPEYNSTCRRQRALRVLLLQIPVSRNSTHRRQGDLLEIHPCVLPRPSSDIPGIQPQVLTKATPVTPIAPETFQSFQTFQTFQSFMTFQPFQAILQILHCSSIFRDSTPFQHSPTRMHILQFLQFDWFPQKTPPSTSWAITNITDITFFKEREML